MKRNLRQRAALAVPALGLAATTLTAAPASATEQYTFVPVRMTVHDIEDWWPDTQDEPRMYYGSTPSWAGVVREKSTVTNLPSAHFTGPHMRVDLWERDNGWYDSNHLGRFNATSDLLDQEREWHFIGNGFHYELVYKVVRSN